MKIEVVSGTMLTLLLTTMLILAFKIELVSAGEYPAIYIDPPTTNDPKLTPGKNYTISIRTDYAGDNIWAYEFNLTYNPVVLYGVKVVNGDLIKEDGTVVFTEGEFDNDAGTLSFAGAVALNMTTTPPVPVNSTGPGILANVTFTVVGFGESPITLGSKTRLYRTDGTHIVDAKTMPDHIQHGYFDNRALTTAVVDAVPKTLNLKSEGRWVTVHVELPGGYDVGDIDVSTILLNYEVTAESSEVSGKKLIVRFDRPKVIALLPQAGEAELTITGILYDGTPFEGSDTIKVKDKRWQEISGVMGIEVDYCSFRTVQSEAGVEAVFNEYVRYCQENHIEVFGGYGNNWRFESASPHGIYEEVKYWKVNASWFDVDAGVWRLKTVFYVSQNGEVVRLLAPI